MMMDDNRAVYCFTCRKIYEGYDVDMNNDMICTYVLYRQRV